MNYCPASQRCIGGDSKYCSPYGVWTENIKILGNTNEFGQFGVNIFTSSRGASVRCASDTVAVE